MEDPGKTVIVLGGGVGGLTAAHELVERGYSIQLFERRESFGGKARSVEVPNSGTGGRKNLPGEHGYRFFPNFYKHVPDTMARIPYSGNARGVLDNIAGGSRTQIARDGRMAIIAVARYPVTVDDWVATVRALIESLQLGIPDEEVLFYVDRLFRLLTTCQERRVAEYEKIPWWDFIDAANKSAAYQQFLVRGTTRSLVALRPEDASTRTVGYVGLQLGLGLLKIGDPVDRVLNVRPTKSGLIRGWNTCVRGGWNFIPARRLSASNCRDRKSLRSQLT